MSFPLSRLQRILDTPPAVFRTGDYISRGFQFMNEQFGMLVGFILVTTVISFFLQSLPFIGILLSFAVNPVLAIGYAQFIYNIKRGKSPDFGDFFKGFTKIGPLLITYLLMSVVSAIALVPGMLIWYKAGMMEWILEMIDAYPLFEEFPSLSEMVDMSLFWIGALVLMAGGLFVGLLFLWALNIAWFFDVSPLTALDASRKLVANHWFEILVFLLLTGLISVSGALLCGIGVLYTAPAMSCAQFFAFADTTNILEDEDTQPDLLDHFIA